MRIYSEELLGQKFGKLTVIKHVGADARKNLIWECLCECGNRTFGQTRALRSSKKTSCGCIRKGNTNSHWRGYQAISLSFWNRIKKDAKKRSLLFALSIKDGWDLFLKQERKCALTGRLLNFGYSILDNKTRTASLDRIDSSGGYVVGNIQWVHKDVNFMKQDFSQEEFFSLVREIYEKNLVRGAGEEPTDVWKTSNS